MRMERAESTFPPDSNEDSRENLQPRFSPFNKRERERYSRTRDILTSSYERREKRKKKGAEIDQFALKKEKQPPPPFPPRLSFCPENFFCSTLTEGCGQIESMIPSQLKRRTPKSGHTCRRGGRQPRPSQNPNRISSPFLHQAKKGRRRERERVSTASGGRNKTGIQGGMGKAEGVEADRTIKNRRRRRMERGADFYFIL